MTVTAERSILADRELIDMLASEPELLAIADALVATTRPATARSARWTRTRLASVAAALALVAAGAALLSLSRWEGAPDLAERALAAVGTGPVLHVQLEQSTTPSQSLVDLRDGSVIPRQLRTEIWFDGGRGLKKTVVALDGHRLDEFLETNEGGWTQGGPIYTCA